MNDADSPEVIELFARISALLNRAIPFEQTIFRSVATRYANEADFLSGLGSARFGGRWNRRGIIAVYGSLDLLTATLEAYQNFADAGFAPTTIRPRVVAGARVRLTRVFDLGDAQVRRRLGFTLRELLDEDWQSIQATGEEAWTQAIGRGCRLAGFEGLLVPSARRATGRNLVIFPDRLLAGSELVALSAKDLPPHPRDWKL